MTPPDIEALGWRTNELGSAMSALAAKAGLEPAPVEVASPAAFASNEELASWMEWQGKLLGCEAAPIETNYGAIDKELEAAYPALLRVSDGVFLAILTARRGILRLLTPRLGVRHVRIADIVDAITEPLLRAGAIETDRLVAEAKIPPSRVSKTLRLLVDDQLAEHRFDQCWILRVAPGSRPVRWLREPNAIANGGRLLAAHTLQYVLWVASWAILGRLAWAGHFDRGWLWAWALLLLTLVPFRLLTTWLQGALAIGIGGILKRRLLAGALRLAPDEIRHQGIGSFLGQVFEAEAVETMALSGAVASVLALIELAVAACVLGRFAILLFVWCCLAALLAWIFLRRFNRWTDLRLSITQELIEAMVGHRTRLAQQPRQEWHEAEDRALHDYLQASISVDRSATWLIGAIPRGWLLAALASLAPVLVTGRARPTEIAVALGGVLLGYTGFRRLAASFAGLAGAWTPWKRVAPLFHAAARPERLGRIPSSDGMNPAPEKLIEADRLTFRYRKEGTPVLQACNLSIRRGDRVLVEGPSGGGKTTFASLLAGLREPESGLLLVNGVDRHTLGDKRWRQYVAAAPQFHENHILTETLAFNLLMGRGWPPSQKDLQEAEQVCRELGLGELLERMPSGLQQMIGEGGWQLSHGERSRVYIARALLQRAGLVILDESFAALDPENLRVALECTLERAETLMVIAHP
ncbi:MAG: ATP-binding cassette domain-containing protein [Acidobacteriaceae bacterium]|nr:ATP-binding cassette domain-containing protein [Acidobacteriaceae bacterium]